MTRSGASLARNASPSAMHDVSTRWYHQSCSSALDRASVRRGRGKGEQAGERESHEPAATAFKGRACFPITAIRNTSTRAKGEGGGPGNPSSAARASGRVAAVRNSARAPVISCGT